MGEKVKVRVKSENSMAIMPFIALRGVVLFPSVVLHFDVSREESLKALHTAMDCDRTIFLVAQKDINVENPTIDDLYKVGVVSEIKQIIKVQNNVVRVLVEGKYRAKLLNVFYDDSFKANVIDYPLSKRLNNSNLTEALVRTIHSQFDDYCSNSPAMPSDILTSILTSDDPYELAELIAGNIQFPYEEKQELLEINSVQKRLQYLSTILEKENEIRSLELDIHEKVMDEMDKSQREYYLREQIKIISEELGNVEDPLTEVDKYRKKVKELNLNQECTDKLNSEIDHLAKLSDNSQEASVIRAWLDTCIDLPWNVFTQDRIDIKKARKYLDKDHYGLVKVKERIIESLAVRTLQPDIKGQILCLVGPPGVGKTSIARSIAESMGRKYARMSLGGIRDEADIRGHRKTYIGSMPGRIITTIKQSGSRNPLILLDEVDKLGNDYRGDPSAALLEVLDGEQNSSFRDHYLEIPFDLSSVFFIATANNKDTIPEPLLDRMEIIDIPSYTREEKSNIAKKHLIPKQLSKHGIDSKIVHFSDSAVYTIIDSYTREAGVRQLEREIATICRKIAVRIVNGDNSKISLKADNIEQFLGPKKYFDDDIIKKDQVGVTNGLAWTAVGGEILQVEAAVMEGSGKFISTGSLGDVMKESVEAAITYIRTIAPEYSIQPTFYKEKDIHIHFPEGAVPKDGPSAGITTCTALVSALSGMPVRHDIAMTGEITLRGRVLPIGGLREKTMAAYKYNIKTIIIPEANMPDLSEIDDAVKNSIQFIPVSDMKQVLNIALLKVE